MRPAILFILLAAAAGAPSAPGTVFEFGPELGTVALTDWPFCDFFVLATADGFATGTWVSGLWFLDEGDTVYGHLSGTGLSSIFVVGSVTSGEMTINITDTRLDLRRAQNWYYKQCKID